MDVPAFHMNAASNSSEGSISDSSKNTLTSLALLKVCASSSAQKAESELSLPKIHPLIRLKVKTAQLHL